MSSGRAVSNAVRTCGTTASSLLPQRHRQDEGASAPEVGLNGEVSVMHACDLSRQPQAEASALHVLRALHAAESSKEVGLVFGADPHAPVDDRNRGHSIVAPNANRDGGPGR